MTKTAIDPEVSAVTEWNEVIRDRLHVRGPLSYTARRGSPFLKLKVGDELRELVEDYRSERGPKKRYAQVRIVAIETVEEGAKLLDMEQLELIGTETTAADLASCVSCMHSWRDHPNKRACSLCPCPRFRAGRE